MHAKNTETHIIATEVQDVFEIYHKHPYIKTTRDAFMSMTLHSPPVITFHRKGANSIEDATDELKLILKMYYVPFLEDIYDWIKTVGVCPWYFETIRDTGHRVPIVPPVGSGYIVTLLNDKHKQEFRWYWNDGGKYDRKMYFEKKDHIPTLNGSLTSPISSLLQEWKTLKLVRQSTEMVAYRQARQQHVFEYHPPRNQVGDDNITTLESFGEKIAGGVMMAQERLQDAKITVRTDALYRAMLETSAANRGMQRKFGTGPFLRSEEHGDQWERENASVIDYALTMKPDFSYKPVPTPKLDIKLQEITQRFDHAASAVMDVPLQMIDSSGRVSTNMQGIMRFVNERIKEWLSFFEQVTKKVFLLSYGKILEESIQRQPYKMLRHLTTDQSVEVHIPVTPVATYADLKQAYKDELYKKETFAEHAFNALGLPAEDIFVTFEAEEREMEDRQLKKREVDAKIQKTNEKKKKKSDDPPTKKGQEIQEEEEMQKMGDKNKSKKQKTQEEEDKE